MKAIVAHEYGMPESLILQDWQVGEPGPDQVKIKVHAAGLAFVDILIAAGKHQFKPPLPYVPGSEFSGEIVAVGAEVGGFAPGDRVCGGNIGGILAQEIVLPARRVQKLPQGVSMDEAAVLRGNFLASWYSLVDCAQIQPGETVLVLGAGGGVGIAACQIARLLGATVIASASSQAKRDLALANGAAHAVDSRAADWREQINALTGKGGVDIVVDPVGGEQTERAFRTLTYKGRHTVIGFASGQIPSLPANLPLLKGASLIGISATMFDQREPEAASAARARILELFGEGKLKPAIGATYPLERFAEAMNAAYSGEVIGRVVLRMS